MGWWSKKQSQSGHWGGRKKGKILGPRRKIVQILNIPDSIMSKAHVVFECGHDGFTWAGCSAPMIGNFGHCRKCIPPAETVQ